MALFQELGGGLIPQELAASLTDRWKIQVVRMSALRQKRSFIFTLLAAVLHPSIWRRMRAVACMARGTVKLLTIRAL
jgi:hypothetical protein